MTELAQGESKDTHQAAYDEPGITHEPPERVDEAQQVLEDEGYHSAEAQYVRKRNANQFEELGTLFEDFTAVVSLAAGDVGPDLQAFHDSMTERLNEKVAELHNLRAQNEAMERKLMHIHELFLQGQESARSIISAPEWPHTAELRETAVTLGESPREAADLFSVLNDDLLSIIFGWLCNVLEPGVAVNFSSACRGQRALTQALRQQLRADHEVVAALCVKVGLRSCKELRESKKFDWHNTWFRIPGLSQHLVTVTDFALLGTLGSVLPALESLYLLDPAVVLSEPAAGPDALQRLAEGLGAGALPAVTFVEMDFYVGDAGASALAAALGRGALPWLKALYLTTATIGDAGLVALAPGLRRLPALEVLCLARNPFGDEGLAALVAPPPTTPAGAPLPTGVLTKLNGLDLSDTRITDAGCATLAAALESGALPKLERLCLDDGEDDWDTWDGEDGTPASAAAIAAVYEARDNLSSVWRTVW
eukprot:scaffold31615_cov32-Phaeocystis_antarctica.AAC.1